MRMRVGDDVPDLDENPRGPQIRIGVGIYRLRSIIQLACIVASHGCQLNKVIVDVRMLLPLWKDIRSDNFWGRLVPRKNKSQMWIIAVTKGFTGRADRRSLELIEDRLHLAQEHRLFERL